MRTTAAILSLSLLSAAAAIASGASTTEASAQYPGARIWVDNDRDYFRRGDRLRINFSTSANSYVAIVHVDPDGYLEFLYPSSPWDAEFVRGGRVHSLDRVGWSNGLTVRGRGGIGYVYVIASPVPLDYGRFSTGSGWDWSYAGRSVTGDPFWAMEQITRMLLPGWGNVPYAADYYTYYVDGIHRYPSYACSSRGYDGWGWGYSSAWSSYYGSCDRLDYFLRDNPYYFDSRRYRGNRRVYYDRYRDDRDWDPRHGYKTDPSVNTARAGARPQTTPQTADRARVAPGTVTAAPASRPAQRAEPSRPVTEPRSAAPRPTSREAEPSSSTPAPRPRATSPRPVERQPERAASPQRPTTTTRPAPAQRPTSTPRAAPAQRPTSTTRSAAPSTRESTGGGSSSATPRSRRGDD